MSRYFLIFCLIAFNMQFPYWIGSYPSQDGNPISDLIHWDQIHGKKKSKVWYSALRHKIIPISQDCSLKEKQKIESVHYFQIQCGNLVFDKLILFKKYTLGDISSIRLERTSQFGNKHYIEISINPSASFKPIPKEKNIPPSLTQNDTSIQKNAYGSNPNLTYFKDMAQKQNLDSEIHPNLSIYFDRTCPLEYLGANHDFYWDDKIFHDFSISCLDQSLVALVRIEADKLGELKVGNVLRKNINQGERFLAFMVLKSWQNDKIQWRDIQLYPYEK